MRFLTYFLPPVPLALFGLLVGMLVRGLSPITEELPLIVTVSLVGGYFGMGLQSALFAVGMLWLDRRRASPCVRRIVAAVAGGLAGSTLALMEGRALPAIQFALLGSSVGVATTLFVDLVAAYPSKNPLRSVGLQLLIILGVSGAGGATGAVTYDWWVERARQDVLSNVAIAMTYDEVRRAVGPPSHDSRLAAFFLPTETVDVVWMYDTQDPGPATILVVSISFKDERVVEISRSPVWRD